LTEHGVSAEDAHVYANGVRGGASIVSVKADGEWSRTIHKVFNSHPFIDPAIRRAGFLSSRSTESKPNSISTGLGR
jgi:hypothetical protein